MEDITLRDHMAGQIMQALIQCYMYGDISRPREHLALQAYSMADEMLHARQKT